MSTLDEIRKEENCRNEHQLWSEKDGFDRQVVSQEPVIAEDQLKIVKEKEIYVQQKSKPFSRMLEQTGY